MGDFPQFSLTEEPAPHEITLWTLHLELAKLQLAATELASGGRSGDCVVPDCPALGLLRILPLMCRQRAGVREG